MSDTRMSITTRDLKLWYGKFQALKGIDLDIKSGMITSLIGPSGCGKTTLLRCFNRINERYGNVTTTGEIKLLGKNIYDPDVSLIELRKAIGMVFQRPNPLPISIYENVVFGLRIHSENKPSRSDLDDAVEKALTEVGLWKDLKDRLNDRAIGLQLEQQQKLCIARLLPLKPQIILMDEPCSALDPIATAKIEELIDELREQFCIVIVTHSMAQAARVSQRTAFFHMGRLVESGPTDEIFTNPKDSRTQDYITGRFG
jgi:phosphate transport system ATP-binding protein